MKEIQLTVGKVAKVDDADFDALSLYEWRAVQDRKKWYAVRSGPGGPIRMHRQILNTADAMETDHINGDGLDNQRANLRECSVAQNQRNRGKQSNNTSGFKGVVFDKRYNKWQAAITLDGKRSLGFYDTPEEGARIYDAVARFYWGEFANTNFEGDERLSLEAVRQRSKERRKSQTTSRFIGVYWFKSRQKWQSNLWVEGKHRFIGFFDTEMDAALAYDRKAKEEFGDKARLNFPDT